MARGRLAERKSVWMAAIIIGSVVAAGPEARADKRSFTFTYETTTMPAGHVEYEQWLTWATDKETDSDFDRLDFRHEIEFGVTDDFQLAFYADWRYEDGASVDDDGAAYHDTAMEAIWSLSDPTADPLGVALYGEIKGNHEFLELEGKLLLQKNVGNWVFAWNGIIEAEWEGDEFHEDKGELGQTLGVSYQFTPAFSLGGELVHEVEYDDWSEWEDHVLYLGPVGSYAGDGWWMGVTPLVQLTDVDSEPDFQVRLIFGIDF